MLGQHAQLLLGVEAALALEHELRRAEPPRPEQRRDARGPRPLAHAVEQLAVAHVVAVDELLVREQVAVGVEDALGEPGRAGGVVQLRRVVRGGVQRLEVVVGAGQQLRREDQHLVDQVAGHPVRVGGVGDQDPRPGVAQAVLDALVAVEHRHRQQDRAQLPGAEEHRRGLRRGGRDDRDPVAALARRGPRARSPPGWRATAARPR